jgi:hypothetical protein
MNGVGESEKSTGNKAAFKTARLHPTNLPLQYL